MIRAALARLQVPSPTTIMPTCCSPGSRGAGLRPWTWESEQSLMLFCCSAALARLLDLCEPQFLCKMEVTAYTTPQGFEKEPWHTGNDCK